MENKEQSIPVIAITAALGAVLLLLFLLLNVFKSNKTESSKDEDKKRNGDSSKTNKKQGEGKKGNSKKGNKPAKPVRKAAAYVPFTHPWLAGSLKGHSGDIVSCDFSMNGKYFVSAADDRVVLLWSVKEFSQKEHKYIRGNVTFDSVLHVAFSPDSKAFVGCLNNDNAVRVFRMAKKDDGNMGIVEGATFPVTHDAEIIALNIASSGHFLMTAGADTTIHLWTPKGEHLATINTNQMQNSCCRVSACARFVASSGFTPDVKVWEVCFDKSGTFKEVKRAFELKGHKAGVMSFDFSNDSTRMASASKDGTWKLWDTDVRYQQDQDPKLLVTGVISIPSPTHLALSPNGLTVAIASDTTIGVYTASNTNAPDAVFENVHSNSIVSLSFDTLSRYLVSAGGRHIQVLHNVTGHRAAIKDFEEKLKAAKNASMQDRLKQQIQEKRDVLDEILLSPDTGTATKAR